MPFSSSLMHIYTYIHTLHVVMILPNMDEVVYVHIVWKKTHTIRSKLKGWSSSINQQENKSVCTVSFWRSQLSKNQIYNNTRYNKKSNGVEDSGKWRWLNNLHLSTMLIL